MRILLKTFVIALLVKQAFAADVDDKAVVKQVKPNKWTSFALRNVRLLPNGPFYKAMLVNQQFLLDADVDRMLNRQRRNAGIAPKLNYPGSNQPAGTRPIDLEHYLSAVSLMYAQTGDKRFLEREEYIVKTLSDCGDKLLIQPKGADSLINRGLNRSLHTILNGKIELAGPDETGYPWGGTMGNDWYGIHKKLAALRDAYVYCDNKTAFKLLVADADAISDFALRANPDLFDNMLDIEHGGMNEVFADLYALTGNNRYMDVSKKFNHQKVILNIANHTDVLYGRHVNMQVPTFVGTARQYQLTGDVVSGNATRNFLDIIYHSYMSCIGGSGRYERYNRPNEITKSLGYTADETCATYNMLKVALRYFETSADLQHMDYYERGLYNHILASQDTESGGVTYYTSLMPGGFKAFSKGFDLDGVWCCVGTGMENHAKYGEAIYFHNDTDVLVNLFIPSVLSWKEKGLELEMQTRFPESDAIELHIKQNTSFKQKIKIRYPKWAAGRPQVWINGRAVKFDALPGGYISLASAWKKGDVVKIVMPQGLRLEAANDDAHMAAIMRGPLVMAGELGADRLPGPDLVRHALNIYNKWIPPTDDIPVLVADKAALSTWIKPVDAAQMRYKTLNAGLLNGQLKDITLIPYYRMRHQRFNVYWKMFNKAEWAQRRAVVSDEVNIASAADEKAHKLQGVSDTSTLRDDRHFWENNRVGRQAKNNNWFSYDLKTNGGGKQYLTVTYWGSGTARSVFDVLVDGQLMKKVDNYDRWPITYYEETYELPAALLKGKNSVTVKFLSGEKTVAGGVYALKLSSNPAKYSGYLFY